jgi:hypothetical protein
MSKFGRKIKQPPPGFEDVEPTLTILEAELREREWLQYYFLFLEELTHIIFFIPQA